RCPCPRNESPPRPGGALAGHPARRGRASAARSGALPAVRKSWRRHPLRGRGLGRLGSHYCYARAGEELPRRDRTGGPGDARHRGRTLRADRARPARAARRGACACRVSRLTGHRSPHPPARSEKRVSAGSGWRIFVDTGGTFTDALAVDASGEVRRAEIVGSGALTRPPPGRPLPVESLRRATTLGTNALLERRGVRTALFVTRGFGDLILIGTQQRPDLFALDVRRPAPLYESVVEVDERVAADGSVLRPLEEQGIRDAASRLATTGVDSAAVALLHSHRNPRHEERVQEILDLCGIRHVSRSSGLAPFIKILPRAET